MAPTVTRRGDAVMLNIGEQLVIRSRQELRDAVIAELEKGERKFVVDFARTGYIDSAGLGVLISISKQIRAQGGELLLTNLNEDLRSLFQLTKLDTLFGIIEPGTDKAGPPVGFTPPSGADGPNRGLTS
jgi:anti-sigma B factor antagonist